MSSTSSGNPNNNKKKSPSRSSFTRNSQRRGMADDTNSQEDARSSSLSHSSAAFASEDFSIATQDAVETNKKRKKKKGVILSAYKKDPSGAARSTSRSVSRVAFRSVLSDRSQSSSAAATPTSGSASHIDVRHRDVTFLDDASTDAHTELPSASKLSVTVLDSTLPMAFDNQRFFDAREGYAQLLGEASVRMAELVKDNDAWQEANPEIPLLGAIWRWLLRFCLWRTTDPINRLRVTRGIQENLHFQSAYESFALGGVISGYDVSNQHGDSYSLNICFENRNASRVLIRNVLSRWDWLWHLHTMIRWSRLFDVLGHIPFLGVFGFPGTENSPGGFYGVRATIRRFLDVAWLTLCWTKHKGLDPYIAAQNLGAESTGLESENRSIHGTHFGRQHTNAFRLEHRLPTDESIIRTFMTSPASTIINNGAEHVLSCLAKHWRNMLFQDNGNFAHQRLELLNPFEVLRFHMPQVLHALANLRGRNVWDSATLGPFVAKLQSLNPGRFHVSNANDVEQQSRDVEVYGPCQAGKRLIDEMKREIVGNVCAGIPDRVKAFETWLTAISDAMVVLKQEAETVRDFVSTVDTGVRLGYRLLKLIKWHVPSEKRMKDAIIAHILNKPSADEEDYSIRLTAGPALQKLAPKDERTLRQLVEQGFANQRAAKLLLRRTVTLLERELRRKALDDRIVELSKGRPIDVDELERSRWYWVDSDDGAGYRVAMFSRPTPDGKRLKFVEVETNYATIYDKKCQCVEYIPIAEAISRAQKAFMTIEMDYCKRFSYNAFMEFGNATDWSSLRTRLRRLAILSQLHSSELDKARLNLLSEIKLSLKSSRKAKLSESRVVPDCRPQNVIVLGGGPTGLLTAIHSAQNVILSGGQVRVYEGRDASDQEASSFERAQIVRLDARQIAMLRYHLGTGFEDVFIPAKGETEAHLGNTIPSHGFVEVTIKRLESMLLDELINLRSKDLCLFYGDSKISYDVSAATFSKQGRSLQLGDVVFGGKDNTAELEVEEFVYESTVTVDDLAKGNDYDVLLRHLPRDKQVQCYRLVEMDELNDWYEFVDIENKAKKLSGALSQLPPIYTKGRGRLDPSGIVVKVNGVGRDELVFDDVKWKEFHLDVAKSHVIIALGKSAKSPSHFGVTNSEPYAVCCIEGLKISLGMHKFGEKRFSPIVDEFRTRSGESNTRLIGDFTKSVNVIACFEHFHEKMTADAAWKHHFDHLASDSIPSLHKQLLCETKKLCSDLTFHRKYLQTRFFELGNNYYLGMELSREFDAWKAATIDIVAGKLPDPVPEQAKEIRRCVRRTLLTLFDRLWYTAVMEVLGFGDVYNDGGRRRIPQLHTIDSPFGQRLGELKEYEAFRLSEKIYRVVSHKKGFTSIRAENTENAEGSENETEELVVPTHSYVLEGRLGSLDEGSSFEAVETFEVISRGSSTSIVRNSSGYVTELAHSVRVCRVSDLARSPDGYSESKVALASFNVSHVVSHRTVHVNRALTRRGEDGFITSFVGDGQASPHFMRYSGLTGASINCMSFSNLVAQALRGVSFQDRIQRFAFESMWSQGEVVQRGTGHCYGEDGFLRPGFSHRELVLWLYGRAVEHREIGAKLNPLLSRDWKVKIASALVPRDLETDYLFYESLIAQLHSELRKKFEEVVREAIGDDLTTTVESAMSYELEVLERRWSSETSPTIDPLDINVDENVRLLKETGAICNMVIETVLSTLHYAIELRLRNERISSELDKQPKPVDYIVDEFAAEAQHTAITLAGAVAYAAATVALGLLSGTSAKIVAALLALWNSDGLPGIMTEVYRYKKRNEEAMCTFVGKRKPDVLKAAFSLLTREQREAFPLDDDPFVREVDKCVNKFVADAIYYGTNIEDVNTFQAEYALFRAAARDESTTIHLMRLLLQQFLPFTFHENSYLQDDLVKVYKALDEMLQLSRQAHAPSTSDANALYKAVVELGDLLESTIDDGELVSIRHGMLTDQRIVSLTRQVLAKVESVSAESTSVAGVAKRLKYAHRDLDYLYHATRERQRSSLNFVAAGLVLCFSSFFLLFMVADLAGLDAGWVQTGRDAAAWAALGSVLGAYLSCAYFVQKLSYLFKLDSTLGALKQADSHSLRRIRFITWSQVVVTVIELVSVLAAVTALPWTVAITTWDADIALSETYPVYLAVAAAVLATLSTFCFDALEFVVRYKLDPALGKVVCELMSDQIQDIRKSYPSTTGTEIETTQKLERKAWTYTMQEFLQINRFDVVFGGDRYGTIVQQIQSGSV